VKRIKTFEAFNAIAVGCLIGGLIGTLVGQLFIYRKTNDRNLQNSLRSLKELSEQGGFKIEHDGDLIRLKADANREFVMDKKNRKVGYIFNRNNETFPMTKMNRADFDNLLSGVEYIEKFDKEVPDCLQELEDFGFQWEVASFDPISKNFSILLRIPSENLYDDFAYSKKHKRDYARFKEEIPPMIEEAIDRIEGEMKSKLDRPESYHNCSYYIKRHENGNLLAFEYSRKSDVNNISKDKFIGDIYEDHFYRHSFGAVRSGFKLFFKTNV